MSTWVYLATGAKAAQQQTVDFASVNHVIYCPAHNSRGARRPRIRDLRPGDRILLAYRQRGSSPIVEICARIAAPQAPVSGTQAVERVHHPLSNELFRAGYTPVAPGIGEVLHLADVHPCQFVLQGRYDGRNAIRKLDPADAHFQQYCPSCALLEEEEGGPAPDVAGDTDATPLEDGPTFPSLAAAPMERVADGRPTERVFDGYVMIDWSSRRQPTMGRDSIWVAWGDWQGAQFSEDAVNLGTRARALDEVKSLLARLTANDRRILLGFDFAFGYPRGFASALGLQQPYWPNLVDHFHRHVQDDERNYHNRDE
ncbi:MAG: hypothetical protein KY476_17730, partial [Planctomycetes bacterium]|nr:hypothetical protein [Planctomycetota bacterium]